MVSGNVPIESFLNSIQAVKDAFLPLESSIKRAAKDLEFSWIGPKKGSSCVELPGELNRGAAAGNNGKNCKIHLCCRKKRSTHNATNDDRKKGLSAKIPVKTFLSMLSPNCGSNDHLRGVSKESSREVDLVKEDGSCMNCLQFAMTWSLLLNGFVQAFQIPFKSGKKRGQKVVEEEKDCSDTPVHMPTATVSQGFRKKK
ncbi:hypothetical protein Nepgr_015170 [Nepenthes gracilis]|uniref:Uncharacterized protein n=1 Tax=Nepenthes gracilis TaxID=150966 RepID=A0AAD3SMB0_NEPGR|nr:hypothetical protein Nepgr_015170 [Nepenthes gracilis]